jgi:hypothetical protein
MGWNYLAQDGAGGGSYKCGNEPSDSIKYGESVD